ncbi:MAG: hypothetical protein AB7G11_02795 [Phycisphaerales bacterium]
MDPILYALGTGLMGLVGLTGVGLAMTAHNAARRAQRDADDLRARLRVQGEILAIQGQALVQHSRHISRVAAECWDLKQAAKAREADILEVIETVRDLDADVRREMVARSAHSIALN